MTQEQYQRLFDIVWVIALILGCIVLLAILSPASASIDLVNQGDVIYMNETYDLSLAVSWPDFTVAWCKSGSSCVPPSQTVTLDGNIEKYYIDPAVFNYGTYYRWDGEWHSAEYSVAFVINPGTKPAVTPTRYIPDDDDYNAYDALPTPRIPGRTFIDGPYTYLIARGDNPLLSTRINKTDKGHLWIFWSTLKGFNLPLEYSDWTYSYQTSVRETLDIQPGTYPGYIQLNGANGLQDIFTDKEYLDTPYDDNIYPDVPIMTWNMGNAKTQFDTLRTSMAFYDDDTIPISVTVAEPVVTITDVMQDESKLYISGTTTWGNGTEITLQLDPDNYVLDSEKRQHTWKTYATGDIDKRRTFSTALNLNKEELYLGAHDIVMSVDNGIGTSVSTYTFKVTDVYIMPTPTPERVRTLTDANYQPIGTLIQPTPEPTQIKPVATIAPPPPATTTQPTPTPVPTPVQTTVVAAKETLNTIPVNPVVGIAAIGLCIVIMRRRS